MDVNACSGRTLAFLGDAVWSLLVREYLIERGEGKGKLLQQDSIALVSAKAQASFYEKLHTLGYWSEEEEEIFRRGRNANGGSVAKNTDVQVYRISTGFEAVFGALELQGNKERIQELFQKILEVREV